MPFSITDISPKVFLPQLTLICATGGALILSACETTPKPEPVTVVTEAPVDVEIFEPVVEPQPSVDVNDLSPAEFEALMGYPKPGYEPVIIAEPEPEPEPEPVPRPVLSPLQQAEQANTPDQAIKILLKQDETAKTKAALIAAYAEKLDVDKAKGNNKGAAEAIVYLASPRLKASSTSEKIDVLKEFLEAVELDPSNSEATNAVASLRSGLKPYADSQHKEAVSFFVAQDFEAAAKIWENVLIIDPDNSSAKNWYEEASNSLVR